MRPKILYVAPYGDFSGYASVSRDYIRALSKVGADLSIRPLRYDGGNYRDELLTTLENKSLVGTDILIQQTTPNEMEYRPGVFNVGVFCWETDRIPDIWINSLNHMDLVVVPCEDNLQTIRRCSVVTPSVKVHYATDLEKYKTRAKPYLLPVAEDSFKFLSIFQYSKKKAFDALLKAYLSEFREHDPVCLVVKTYIGPNDTDEEAGKIQYLISAMKDLLRIGNYPKIHLIHGILPHHEMARLYSTADCYVLPSRGEGWGVPHFDALGYGLPAIATKGTGPEEFIDESCGWLVDSHMSPVCDMPHPHNFLYTGLENWHEPHVGHLKGCMREAFSMWEKRPQMGAWANKCAGATNRVEQFSHEIIGGTLQEVIVKHYDMWKKAQNVC